MTLNLSGGREQGLAWGLSSTDPSQFLGDLANDPAVANLFKNSFSRSLPDDLNSNSETKGRDKETRCLIDEREWNTAPAAHLEGRKSFVRSTKGFADSTMNYGGTVVEERASTRPRSNGWTSNRPQTLLQNGLNSSTHMSTICSPKSPILASPLAPSTPMYHSPSPHSTPPHQSHSPHYHNSSSASSPATPTDIFPSGGTSMTTCARTQPVAPSPFVASRLPTSLPVNLLNQISNYDLVDTMVTLKSSSRDVVLQGQVGVVKYVMTGEMATVHILSTESDIRVPCSSLEAIKPRLKDVVKVIGGTHCLGRIGMLVTITGDYGIVKFLRGNNIAQIPIKNLGKYSPTKASGVKAKDYLSKSATSPQHSQSSSSLSTEASPSSSKDVSSDPPFSSVSNTTSSFPFMALHYPSFPLFIPGASPQAGCFVSLPGSSTLPTAGSNDAMNNGDLYTPSHHARLFPSMMPPFMFSSGSETSNGMGTNVRDMSSSSSSSSNVFSHNPFLYPPTLSRGHSLKSDDLSPPPTYKDPPSFSFSRQDSTEKDSVQHRAPPTGLVRPPNFLPSPSPPMSLNRPTVIQSSSSPSADKSRKGLLQPSHAIERAKVFMAMCSQRGGPVARGGGGGVVRGGSAPRHSLSDGRAPPPYSTTRLGPHSSGQTVQKLTPEEKIGQFLARIVQHRRSYGYRRNSGEGDVKTSCIRISLVCPLSQKRMSYPCRGQSCRHHQCFDADAYVRYNLAQKAKKKVMKQPNGKGCVQAVVSKKWQCPICHATVPANQLYIDKDIYSAVKESSAQEVELTADGTWQPVKKEENKIEIIDLTDLDD